MRAPVPLVVCVLLALPIASASWSVWGSTEPDTPFDIEGWGWTSPDTSATGARIYFNVVAEEGSTGQNPNAADLGTALPAPTASYSAFFGVWKDCNHDGYVGMAQGGLLDYRADLPLGVDTTICPVDFQQGSHLVHNDGTWITELLTLGPATDTRSPGNFSYVIPTLVNDTGAQVWGDRGAPGEDAVATCPVAPMPRGTTASTGALLAYEDCLAAAHAEAPDAHAPVSLWGDPGASAQPGLLRRDGNDPHPAFTTFDCAQPKGGADVKDPTGGSVPTSQHVTDPTPFALLTGRQSFIGEGILVIEAFPGTSDGGPGTRYVNLTDQDGTFVAAPAVTPGVSDPQGSYADGASGAERATVEGCRYDADGAPLYKPGQAVDFVPSPEGDVRETDLSAGKRENDIVFDLTQYSSSFQEGGEIQNGRTGVPFLGDLAGHNMPQDGGAAFLRDAGGAGPGWHSLGAQPLTPSRMSRDDLDPLAPKAVTFFAHASLGVRQRFALQVPGGTGTYGNEVCGAGGSYVIQGWDCDATHWWTPRYASARPENPYSHRPLGAVLGDPYELRDVDVTQAP